MSTERDKKLKSFGQKFEMRFLKLQIRRSQLELRTIKALSSMRATWQIGYILCQDEREKSRAAVRLFEGLFRARTLTKVKPEMTVEYAIKLHHMLINRIDHLELSLDADLSVDQTASVDQDGEQKKKRNRIIISVAQAVEREQQAIALVEKSTKLADIENAKLQLHKAVEVHKLAVIKKTAFLARLNDWLATVTSRVNDNTTPLYSVAHRFCDSFRESGSPRKGVLLLTT